MRSPLVTRKRYDAAVEFSGKQAVHIDKLQAEVAQQRAEAATWRVEYRKIRDRIVGIATHPGATPQIRATLAEFASTRP